MTKEQAEFLSEIMAENGVENEVMANYSGRGMYGEQTHALIVDNPIDIIKSVIMAMSDFFSDPDSAPNEFPDFNDFNPRTDSMGKGAVIY